ncbi:LrgB-like family-domain-containing protein [Annulohypoxylon maeteangense]|uniref:LrgB-like family-domain-containing protein n=1 Tax=Annulohypoxylon maeteangense TaxID=1927788 RepID=UPI00200882E4|nr:LrgB-like family-domain-containing protein [Annulohypoxylon maeteangense]KAI0886658.1 LrgB-like family-domain-containing protein [Annulohypoxylon maeteangense]
MATVRKQALDDLLSAVQISFRHSRHNIIQAWLYVPFGIILMLLACFGVNKLFGLGSVAFPSSVACLVILFLALLLSEQVLGEHRTKRIVGVIEIPGGWALRWINVLFTPSFVLLPLSPSIGGIEVLKIIAVFIIGFVVMMGLAAYMTRALQLLLGSSKRAMTARAEELNPSSDEIPMTTLPASAGTSTPAEISDQLSSDEVDLQRPLPSQDAAPAHRAEPSPPTTPSPEAEPPTLPPQAPIPPSRSVRWAAILTTRLDLLTYSTLFLLVGVPVYYTTNYAMPLHLTVNILTYMFATSLPPTWRTYLHPVLLCSLLTALTIYILALPQTHSLSTVLTQYKTGTSYTTLWSPRTTTPLPPPGAGDIFASILDASIISFALPVYQYRRELRQHLTAILVPTIAISIGSLFAYPPICHAIGISAPRSLAFAARSLTLALAVPATANLGGDVNTVAALAIMSGILGVLVGRRVLGWLRIPEDDYVTRGVTLGANSSAIAAALLLRTDPRAAALSILSMSLFGTITVLFTSIPPMTVVIQSLVGM